MSAMIPPVEVDVRAGAPAMARARVGGVLRVMFWKEVRELAPWAGLAMAGFSLALGFVLYAASHAERDYRYAASDWRGSSIIGNDYYMVTALLIPIMALLLGFMQFVAESKPDRYAFLVHRPSGRGLMFWAKVVPGMAVYLAVTVLPLAAAVMWAKDPHHVAYPFWWGMLLPSVADVCAGIPYYFAGVLVARRTEARWWGSRLLPMAVPVIASALNYGAAHFCWGVVGDGVAAVVLLAAARGAFLGGGEYFPQPRLAKAALGGVLAVGLFTVGGFALVLLMQWVDTRASTYRNTVVMFMADGTPIRAIHESINRAPRYEDLEGKRIEGIPAQDSEPRAKVLLGTMLLASGQEPYGEQMPYRFAGHYVMSAFSVGEDVWWYRPARGDYLVGFDVRHHELIGSIGPDGLAAGKAFPPARFKAPVVVTVSIDPAKQRVRLIAGGDTLYRLGEGYRLEPLFVTPDHAAIVQMGLWRGGEGEVSRLAIVTEEQVFVVEDGGSGTVVARINHGQNSKYSVSVGYVEKTGEFLFEFSPVRYGRHNVAGPRVAEYVNGGDGAVREVGLPENEYKYERKASVLEHYAPALCPPVGFVVVCGIGWVSDPAGMAKDWVEIREFLGYSLVLSLVMAGVIFGLGGWLAMPRGAKWFWVVMGFLLGPVGLLLMLCMGPLAHRVVCPGCGRRRAVTEGLCERCGAEFALPGTTGTEVFG